jgi:hypothetical protein
VAKGEAERLNAMGLGSDQNLTLVESRIERLPSAVRITHIFDYRPLGIRLQTEPYTGYD